ncbi:MAG: hypothetical protein AAF600_01080 [Bacteroidota bacterium]
MKRFLFTCLIITGCNEKPKITGLWELQAVSIDMIDRGHKSLFIKFEESGSFSVSQESGDVIGLYALQGDELKFYSTDEKWFNRKWTIKNYKNELIFAGIGYGYTKTELRFKNVNEFPAFEEFQERLNGDWQLYKLSEDGRDKRILSTYFRISADHYAIAKEGKIIEEGDLSVDTRHQKISFETTETIWNARFVWDELRLENKESGLTYRLKKLK